MLNIFGVIKNEKTDDHGKLLAQLLNVPPRISATDGKSNYSHTIPGKDNLL